MNGSFFDVTIGIKKHSEKVVKNEYYLAITCESCDIKTKEAMKVGASMYNFADTETHIVFKTNIKEIEKEFREYLTKLDKKNQENKYKN